MCKASSWRGAGPSPADNYCKIKYQHDKVIDRAGNVHVLHRDKHGNNFNDEGAVIFINRIFPAVPLHPENVAAAA